MLGIAYLACLDEVAGLFADDGWYIVLAQALATGRGFTLINLPVEGVTPFYPPGFPALLALVFLVAPDFPANVPLLKAVSVGALLLGAVLLRRYFLRYRGESPWVASGLALLVVAHAMMHFLLTSAVLSEGLFVCVQAAAIIAVERLVCDPSRSRGRAGSGVLLAAALVVATSLVRSIGGTLVPAAGLYVLLRGGLRKALSFAVAVAAFLLPWQIHAALHAPSEQQRIVVNDGIVWSYAEHFKMRRAGHVEFGYETIADIPARVDRNLRRLASEAVGSLYAHPVLERTALAPIVSLGLAALTLLGLAAAARQKLSVVDLYVPATIGLLLVFGFEADRYLLPLLPFLVWHAMTGCRVALRAALRVAGFVGERAARQARVASTGLLLLLVLVNAFGIVRDVADTLGAVPGRRTGWRRAFAENLSLLEWVRTRISRDVVLATHNPGMVFLYTGNPTVGTWKGETNAANWRTAKARFWVDNTVAEYRFPDMERSGIAPLVKTDALHLGVYKIPAPGSVVR